MSVAERIPEEGRAALCDFTAVAASRNVKALLIGAGARLMILDWKIGIHDLRHTLDWDFGVQLPSWQAFDNLREALVASGRFLRTSVIHKVRHINGVTIEFIPFGGIENPAGQVTFGSEDGTITVLGHEEAYENAHEMQLGSSCPIRIVSLPGFVILKTFSYNDRTVDKKTKDLKDIHAVLEHYLETDLSRQRFLTECYGEIEEAGLTWETGGAWLAGKDAASIAHRETALRMLSIIERLCDEDRGELLPLMSRQGFSEKEAVSEWSNCYALFNTFLNSFRLHRLA